MHAFAVAWYLASAVNLQSGVEGRLVRCAQQLQCVLIVYAHANATWHARRERVKRHNAAVQLKTILVTKIMTTNLVAFRELIFVEECTLQRYQDLALWS
jgi:hypothetical protein